MSTSTTHGALEFEQRFSLTFRLICLAGGLLALVLPAWELRWGWMTLNWFLPVTGVIVLGSMAVGAFFMAAAVAGDDVKWQIANRRLTLYRRSWLRERTELVKPEDVRGTSVEIQTWDSRSDSYRVCLELRNGLRHVTPDFATRPEAEAAEEKIRNLLGLPRSCRDSSAL